VFFWKFASKGHRAGIDCDRVFPVKDELAEDMLPAPVTFRRNGRSSRGVLTTKHGLDGSRLAAILRAPARLTNFAFALLFVFAAVSLLLNIRHWFSYENDSAAVSRLSFPGRTLLPPSIATTLAQRRARLRSLDHLVLVPGHGVWIGSRPEDVLDERTWLLADFQRNRGRPATLLEHIRHG
jgi:hypothetical protein